MEEIWKDVKGYEGLYQVSNLGRIKSFNYMNTGKEKILKNRLDKGGYYSIVLYKNGKYINKKVHRLVAEAFIPNLDNLPQVNHKDENKLNNRVDNLEWCTAKYNNNYGTHNLKLSLSLKGKAGRPGKAVHCIDLDIIYESASEAERQTGIQHISEVCSGKRESAGGMWWEWV